MYVPHWLKPWPAPELPPPNDQATQAPVTQTHMVNSEPHVAISEDISQASYGPTMGIPITGAAIGFAAGSYQAGSRTSLVFMAENAHRRPETVQGWYFYNKTKNYRVLLAAVRGGARTSARVGLWTLTYVSLEALIEQARLVSSKRLAVDDAPWNGKWINGATAGLSIALGASSFYRIPLPIAKRAALFGTVAGGSVGALRDVQRRISDKKLQLEVDNNHK